MTLLLASVLSHAEAKIALARGADVIDCKDPARGALGALPLAEVSAVVAAVAGAKPVSAVVELPHDVSHARKAIEEMIETGVDFVKFAVPATPDAAEVVADLAQLAAKTKLVAVLFADLAPDFGILDDLARAGFFGAMLDTAHKGKGRLIDHMEVGMLASFVSRCQALGLKAGLAGSLEAPDVPRLLVARPDVLGFRGALCARGERREAIDAAAVGLIRDLIPGAGVRDAETSEDTDIVFLHDYVVPVEIGAYAFEHGHTQRVRFNVDAEVLRHGGDDDMRQVFSYDVVMDAIKAILSGGHVVLVETIAERLAESVLLHELVRAVTVQVEKLDVAPGAVGVKIRRSRPNRSA